MYKKKSDNNTPITTLYAPGFSSLKFSYYKKPDNNKTYLTFNFNPYTGKDIWGNDAYSKDIYKSVSLNEETAATFNALIIPILNGTDGDKPIESELQCNSGATLTFEYKPETTPDQPDQTTFMSAFLTINKEKVTIPFRFPTFQQEMYSDGKPKIVVSQHGLGVLSNVIKDYLLIDTPDKQWCNLSDREREEQRQLAISNKEWWVACR